MKWEIEYTDEFGQWWDGLSEGEQESVRATVKLLGAFGPQLRFPHSSDITASRHGNMRELRIQHSGRPYRVLYAFDPRRCAILLIGGDKTGKDRWYEKYVPIADRLYNEHLETLRREGSKNGT
ncbi:MAG: type II toxin-antitoxin system RelE/ParE family toxin [Desulfobacteraceae bacterium]|nr:type II toxin-antitoxin system RelE/ParE family toxin [Desulfobacteraceae bacterium]